MNRTPDIGDTTPHSPRRAIVKSSTAVAAGAFPRHGFTSAIPADRSSVAARFTRSAIARSARAR